MEASEEDEVSVTASLIVDRELKMKNRKKNKQKRRVCSEKGHYNKIVRELKLWDSAVYRRFLRMLELFRFWC